MNLWQDIRFALRSFARSPLFTAVAILSLTLGIGANTAIFSLIDQLLLRSLPVQRPQRLVLLVPRGNIYSTVHGSNVMSYPLYRDIRDGNQVFEGVLARFPVRLTINTAGLTERASGEIVSGNYFRVLGVKAIVGRTILAGDDRGDASPVAMLSYRYWQRRFHGSPAVIGRTLAINAYRVTVIGVAARGFDGMDPFDPADMFVPVAMKPRLTPTWNDLENRRTAWLNVYARLKPGVTIARAKASLAPLYASAIGQELADPALRNLSTEHREEFLKSFLDVFPGSQGRSPLRRRLQQPLWVLMATVAVVLLIACANVANLTIVRATARRKEFAIRLAMGAGRARLIVQVLVESVLLACGGACAGILLAWWTVRSMVAFFPASDAADTISASPDWRVLAFTVAAAVLTGVLFGLAPALQASRTGVAPALKENAPSVAGGTQVWLRKLLACSQVALSLVLLIAAALFVRTLQNLERAGPGFDAHNLVSFTLDPALNGYQPRQTRTLYGQMLDRLRRIPGVHSAALAGVRLLDNTGWSTPVTVRGRTARSQRQTNAFINIVSPGYLGTLGVPLLAGREFTYADVQMLDDHSLAEVCMVSASFARDHFGGPQYALGQLIGIGSGPGASPAIRVVGVTADFHYADMREVSPQVLFPWLEAGGAFSQMTAYVRTSLPSSQMFDAIRRTLRGLDPNLPAGDLRTLEDQLDRALANERLIAWLTAAFGVIATTLAAVGLYGVLSFGVERRRREIGVRVALGAAPRAVLWLVLREALLVACAGVAGALPAAWALTRLVRNQLYGVAPHDPVTIASAVGVCFVMALLAGLVPAARAMRLDPARVLRCD